MKRTLFIATTLLVAAHTGLAMVIQSLQSPQDDSRARSTLSEHSELKSVAGELWDLVENRVCPLTREGIDKIFGPKLDDPPKDLVLPVFAPDSVMLDGTGKPELHAIGNLGYIECYYDNYRGKDAVIQWAWYHRADGKFVPLKSADDFAKRLEWDKAKLAEIKQWLSQHLPAAKDLGLIEISPAAPTRVALGSGQDCIITTSIETFPGSANWSCYATVTDDSDGENFRNTKTIRKPITGANSTIGFSVDEVLYSATLKLVEPLVRDLGVVELTEGVPSSIEIGGGRKCNVTAKTLTDGRVSLNFQITSGNILSTWISKPGDSACFTTGGQVFKLTPAIKVKPGE